MSRILLLVALLSLVSLTVNASTYHTSYPNGYTVNGERDDCRDKKWTYCDDKTTSYHDSAGRHWNCTDDGMGGQRCNGDFGG